MLVRYNASYNAVYINVASSFTGFFDKKYNDVEYYFQLKKTNKQLAEENAMLKNVIMMSIEKNGDTSSSKLKSRIDSIYRDSSGRNIKYMFTEAKVVNNSVYSENNYITIQKGSKDGVTTDMAVIGPKGIVGHIVSVSKNYSVAMSLLNHNSRVSVMLKGKPFIGIVDWDGVNPTEILLHNVPKNIKINKGDSVITSNLSESFPPGLMVGRADRIRLDAASNLMDVVLKTSTDFSNLQYVYLIKNFYFTEQKGLEQATMQQQPVKAK